MSNENWLRICSEDELSMDAGVCALLHEDSKQEQIAIFKLSKPDTSIFAIGNFDPIGQANVLYRGIIGSVDNEPVVASPLYKQHYSLKSGTCLQQNNVSVPVYPVRVNDGFVELLTKG